MKEEIGKPKFEYKSFAVDHDVYEFIEANFAEDVKQALQEADKETRDNNVAAVSDKIATAYAENLEKKLQKNTKLTLEKQFTN